MRSTTRRGEGTSPRRPFSPVRLPRPQLSLERLRRDPLGELARLGERGPLTVAFLGRQRIVYLSDPELVHAVCVGFDRRLGRARPVRRWWLIQPVPRLEGPELSTHDRAVYMKTRRLVVPFYGREASRALVPDLAELAELFLGEAAGRELDLFPFLEDLLVASAVRMVVGSGAPVGDVLGFTPLYRETRRIGATSFTSPLRRQVAAVRYRGRRRAAAAAREEIARRVLELRRDGRARDTTVAGLVERGELSLDMAAGLVETVAEPTAPAFAFLVSALARPEVSARLAPEATAFLSAADPQAAPAVDAAAHEALRLGAPWRTNRIVLEPFAVAGFDAKPGDVFITSPALLHRDPRFWAEPHAFRLEHWLAAGPRPARAFIPFGFASRACAGRRMATLHLAVLAALLARDWKVECEDATAVEWRATPGGLLEPPGGLRCRFVRRIDGPRGPDDAARALPEASVGRLVQAPARRRESTRG